MNKFQLLTQTKKSSYTLKADLFYAFPQNLQIVGNKAKGRIRQKDSVRIRG